jgi:hypothetical protein
LSGEVIFSTSDPEWRLPQGLNTLEVDQAEVKSMNLQKTVLRSPNNMTLLWLSDG